MTEFHALQSDRDRRGNAPYPLRLKLTFSAVTPPICSGDGETLHISRKELLFTTNESFAVGKCLQVSMDWPARPENTIPLRLVVSGHILRSGDGQAAMTIDKYQFRIRGIEPNAQSDNRPTTEPEIPKPPGRGAIPTVNSREARLQAFLEAHTGSTVADIRYSAKVHKPEFSDWRNAKLPDTSVMSGRIEKVLAGQLRLQKEPWKSREA